MFDSRNNTDTLDALNRECATECLFSHKIVSGAPLLSQMKRGATLPEVRDPTRNPPSSVLLLASFPAVPPKALGER